MLEEHKHLILLKLMCFLLKTTNKLNNKTMNNKAGRYGLKIIS